MLTSSCTAPRNCARLRWISSNSADGWRLRSNSWSSRASPNISPALLLASRTPSENRNIRSSISSG
ncbi:Uncharacterised protein [Acinetobacter baumannii]|nr:Uncharacterised protein [Acinetobacter baumannii]